jgi:hypothetical protein
MSELNIATVNQTLQGVWHLDRWEITYDNGRATTYPFGANATGLIHYTQDGGMSACIARADRPRLSSDSVRSAPPAEQIAAFESFFQYAGTYVTRMQDSKPQVVHHVTHSLNPNFVGSQQVRNIDLASDGSLTLSASDLIPGTQSLRHHRLIWRRA